MRMITSFLAGALCGLVVGAAAALLLTPASGDELQAQIRARIDAAIEEGKAEMARTEAALAAQFESLRQGRSPSA